MTIKSTINAQYLGWRATSGPRGDEFIDPIMADLLNRGVRRPNKLRRHRLEFDGRQLRIREFAGCEGSSGQCCYRFPSIPLMDIGYAKGNSADERTFGLILIGYNEASSCSVHVHAWRGASSTEAANFAARLAAATAVAAEPGKTTQPARDRYCLHGHPPEQQQQEQQPQQPQQQQQQDLGSLAHSLAQELRQRLNSCDAMPLLHPPRDYDTLHRSHGNAALRCSERQLDVASRAPGGAYSRRQLPIFAAEEATSEEADEPPPDYNWQEEEVQVDNNGKNNRPCARNNSSASGGSSSSSSRAVSDDSRWSDPWQGFSTWARPKAIED